MNAVNMIGLCASIESFFQESERPGLLESRGQQVTRSGIHKWN